MNEIDPLKELRVLGLASRFKRISERLLREATLIYNNADVDFDARWFAITHILKTRRYSSITELASMLGFTHTSINLIAKEMIGAGIIKSSRDIDDNRRRLLSLTAKGRRLVKKLQPLWDKIHVAGNELVTETGVDIIAALDNIEDSLDRFPLSQRVLSGHSKQRMPIFKIVDYRPAYKKNFKSLNLTWLKEYFSVEPVDLELLSDPNGKIIRKGGSIFFALIRNNVAGVCALIKHSPSNFELAKMVVTQKYRRLGIGTALIEAVLSRSRDLEASSVFLLTHPSLKDAVRLYRRMGFVETQVAPQVTHNYKRHPITLVQDIN